MRTNGSRARALVRRIARQFPETAEPCPIGSDRALDGAIITPPSQRDPRLMRKLKGITRRVLAAERLLRKETKKPDRSSAT